MCRLVQKDRSYSWVPTGLQFNEGTPVEFYAGYDGNNPMRFKGFIKRINFKVPVEIECEGYSYQLRAKMFSKSYVNTTVRNILEDLIEGTDIKLSEQIPVIPIPKVWFKNYTGIQVLEYFKEKCLLTVYFNYDELYVGLRASELKGTVKHRLNWNVIQDNELMFNADKEFATVNIQIEKRTASGHKVKGDAEVVKPGNVKVKRISLIENAEVLKQIADEEKRKLNNKGYSGRITTFLFPFAEPGMSDDIFDRTYADRKGLYFIEGVSGSIDPRGGGRQRISIGFSLGNG